MTEVMDGTAMTTAVEVAAAQGTPPAAAPGTEPPAEKLPPSPERQRLIDLMDEIGFGRIEGLEVRAGDPVFEPAPIVRRLHVFGKPNGRPPSRPKEDCRAQRLGELFEVFDQEGTFVLDELIVDSGLPVRMSVRTSRRA